mgnify:FL=1
MSQVHQPNRMLVNMVGVPLHGWCTSTWLMQFYSVGALETSAPPEVALNSEKFTLP